MWIREYFKKFQLGKVWFGTRGVEAEMSFQDKGKDAAWELYVELLTRVTISENFASHATVQEPVDVKPD